MARKVTHFRPAAPPPLDQLPLVNASAEVARWLEHYWRKLKLPSEQAHFLGVTDDRQEFARWTGRRLNPMALGCYCYLPLPPDDAAHESEGAAQGAPVSLGRPANPGVSVNGGAATGGYDLAMRAASSRAGASVSGAAMGAIGVASVGVQLALPGFADATPSQDDTLLRSNPALHVVHEDGDWYESHDRHSHDDEDEEIEFRHLIFVEPELLPEGIEVTVAHELIHLADRASGHPRKHHCHGHDSISMDEAALTERDPAWLRDLLAEETRRREATLRLARPYRYFYVCPNCGKEYPRVLKYRRAVSCGHCDHRFNPAFLLRLRDEA